MKIHGTVEMQTLKMAAHVESLPCYLCGEGNHRDNDRCHRCFAPLAIAYQAATQKTQPSVIAAFGMPGAGKTTYLGLMADLLSRQPHELHWLARGAFSVSLQQETIHALAACEFPPPTPTDAESWHWIFAQVGPARAKRPLDLVLPDVAGAALVKEIEKPQSIPAVRALAAKAGAALVLIDAPRTAAGGSREDFATLKLLTYLREAAPRTAPDTWQDRPLAIVFTKADACDVCREDPDRFARDLLPGVRQLVREHFPRTAFFAASAAAGCAARVDRLGQRVTVPLRIEPRGVVEPFRWLIEQLATAR